MIVLVTDNLRKLEEHRRILRRYHARVERRARAGVTPEVIATWLAEEPTLTAVLDETSWITAPDGAEHLSDWRDARHHLATVVNRGTLWAWVRGEDGIREERYERVIAGWLDHGRHDDDAAVFDWDAIFVVGATGLTYEQMRRRGLKSSVRDLLLADFLIAHLYFVDRVDLAWSPQRPERAVDLRRSVGDFLAAHPLLDRARMAPWGLDAMLDHVVADGVFFRAAENRRQRNYWAPGLNGGVPLTPKRDAVHEITFMVHDLMHQLLPDLVFTGVPDGEDHATWRNVYCVWRMLSEAFTLALADMLFVDGLARSGLEYDFAKRRIWPLFAKMALDGERDARLRRLLHANARYAVAGDDAGLRALRAPDVAEADFDAALADYQGKYEGYFRADWSWTVNNFEAMAARSEVFARWGRLAGDDLFARCRLVTLDDMVGSLRASGAPLGTLDEVIEAVFERAVAQVIERATPPRPHDRDEAMANAARRYFTGQLLLFAAWDILPHAKELGDALARTLRGELTPASIDRIDERFAAHLALMVERQLISEDDRRTWLGAHPLFDPSYVAYDRRGDDVASLRETARACFAAPSPARASAAVGGATFLDLARLWASVRGVAHPDRLGALLAAAGVRFHDDARRLVRAPVVAICGVGGLPIAIAGGAVTVAGAPIDEAVAATRDMMGFAAAMSYLNPKDRAPAALFERVAAQGHASVAHGVTVNVLFAGHSSAVEHELACQRDLVHLARLTVARTPAQSDPPIVVHDPALAPLFAEIRGLVAERVAEVPERGADRREAVNALYPAAKASLLLVSGSLRNLAKLVAQRDDPGKERELRDLLRELHASLSALWPALYGSGV